MDIDTKSPGKRLKYCHVGYKTHWIPTLASKLAWTPLYRAMTFGRCSGRVERRIQQELRCHLALGEFTAVGSAGPPRQTDPVQADRQLGLR